MEELTCLNSLNLTDNCIETISGLCISFNIPINIVILLAKCEKLNTLQLKRNRIGENGLSDVKGLLECPSIS